MSRTHLSELCSKDEVEPIYVYLRQIAPDAIEWADDGGRECEEDSIQYMNGVWGFRDADGRTAFHWAIALRNYGLANTLMKAPYRSPVLSEDEDGVTPFMTACMVGAPEKFVAALLEESISVYDRFLNCPVLQRRQVKAEGGGRTNDGGPKAAGTHNGGEGGAEGGGVVNNAARNAPNEAPASHELVARTKIVNAEDTMGNTALLHVASRGHNHLIDFLIRNGADLNHQNKRGQTALHRSVGRGNTGTVESLLCASKQKVNRSKEEHRRWVNLQDDRGDTALFYASMENNEDLGSLLLQNGANRDLRNKDGKSFWEV